MDTEESDQFETNSRERRERFESEGETFTLNLTEHEVELLITHYCELNAGGCIDFDAGSSDFRWWQDRCHYFSEVSGVSANEISVAVHERREKARRSWLENAMEQTNEFLVRSGVLQSAQDAPLSKNLADLERLLWDRRCLAEAQKERDAGHDPSNPAVKERIEQYVAEFMA